MGAAPCGRCPAAAFPAPEDTVCRKAHEPPPGALPSPLGSPASDATVCLGQNMMNLSCTRLSLQLSMEAKCPQPADTLADLKWASSSAETVNFSPVNAPVIKLKNHLGKNLKHTNILPTLPSWEAPPAKSSPSDRMGTSGKGGEAAGPPWNNRKKGNRL